MTSTLQRSLPRYAAYFLAWTVFGLFMFSQGMIQKIVSTIRHPGGITLLRGWWECISGP